MLLRMRSVELTAELVILLIEGPQDKKSSVDLYYGQYRNKFAEGAEIERRLKNYWNWILKALPKRARQRLLELEKQTKLKEPPREAARYLAAASRQTDNLTPRKTRIEILISQLTT